jgi:hypothetical protein
MVTLFSLAFEIASLSGCYLTVTSIANKGGGQELINLGDKFLSH